MAKKSLRDAAADMLVIGQMLIEQADDLDRILNVDLSALSVLFGGSPPVEQPRKAAPAREVQPDTTPFVPNGKSRIPKRALTKGEKQQIRQEWALLPEQNKNKELRRVLAEKWGVSITQLSAVLFHDQAVMTALRERKKIAVQNPA